MTVLVGNAAHVLTSAAGAHAIMQHIHTTLVGVGLTKANWTGTYDGSGAGSSSQAPTSSGTYSAWQAFNFSDTHQTAKPITVWFRLAFGSYVSASSNYQVHWRISEGVSGTGVAQGRIVEYSPPQFNYSSGAAYQWLAGASVGDFARYSGDALTLVVGASSMNASVVGSHRRGIIELHIERRYKVNAVTPDAGFVGLMQISMIGNTQFGQVGTASLTSLAPSTEDVSEAWAQRAGGTRLDYISSAAVVAPVYYNDVDQAPTTYRRMFTIPGATVTNGAIIALDFSGVEKRYLVHKPNHSSLYNTAGYALLFEWE